jgi:hypothetical protein
MRPTQKPGGWHRWLLSVLVGTGLMLLGLATYLAWVNGELVGKMEGQEEGCHHSPVTAQIPGLQREPCQSERHVAETVAVQYATDPPTSGDHYPQPLPAGCYAGPQQAERLVHSLEHGNVVIYYNKALLDPVALDMVQGLCQRYKGSWDGVLTVPRDEMAEALILTAWEHSLRLPAFDADRLSQFVDLFRGRGPERIARPLR